MTEAKRPFRIGVNYWPRSSAMYWWLRFDAGEVEEDFARIAEAGFDSVRIFTLWEDFQPEPQRVSVRCLDRLVEVAEIAGSNGVGLVPTLFTGHMSGANWIPRWAVEPKAEPGPFPLVSEGREIAGAPVNWYTDPGVRAAQARLAREIASALRGHPAMWAYDLGNEPSNAVRPPARELGRDWLDRIADAIRSTDPAPRLTIGLHPRDLEEDTMLGPAEAARVADFLCMHGYPVYSRFARGPDDDHLLPFLGLLTRQLGGTDVLFAELGAPTRPGGRQPASLELPLLTEDAAAGFIGRALDRLRESGHLGAMIWCYADYAAKLASSPPFDRAPHEMRFGLFRADGSPKPAVEEVRRHTALERREAPRELSWFDVDPARFYESEPSEALPRLYGRYLEHSGAAA
jgi:endo-1,4-beta-mannosidase